jgi:hypothetical protein
MRKTFVLYLISANTRLEIQIRNIHFFKTKRAFSIILEMIAMVSLSQNMVALLKVAHGFIVAPVRVLDASQNVGL